jgi:anti-anti-sigma regulatory factor
MAGRKKKTTSVLGDDPLSWLGKDDTQAEQQIQNNTQPDTNTNQASADPNPVAASDKASGEPVNISLDPVITLTEVSQLRDSLLGHTGASEIHIDVSKVEHIDTAGMQLLLAFSKAIQKQGGKLSWTGWSAAYSGTAELLGLTSVTGAKEG